MKALASLQHAFQRHVYRPGDAMQRAVLETARANAPRRLGVYAEAYRLRLIEALGNDFPALHGLLGEAAFRKAMRAFVETSPSRTPNLRWYGAALPAFLARRPPWQRRPLLSELARFEWTLGLAFDAADAPLASADDVARLAPEQWPGMRLRLHPSVQRLALRSNAPRIWQAVVVEAGKPPAARMRLRAANWLIWRKGHDPFYRALEPAEAWALRALAHGADFARLTGGLSRQVGSANAAQTGVQFLRNWLAEGLISEVLAPAV